MWQLFNRYTEQEHFKLLSTTTPSKTTAVTTKTEIKSWENFNLQRRTNSTQVWLPGKHKHTVLEGGNQNPKFALFFARCPYPWVLSFLLLSLHLSMTDSCTAAHLRSSGGKPFAKQTSTHPTFQAFQHKGSSASWQDEAYAGLSITNSRGRGTLSGILMGFYASKPHLQ